MRDSLVKACNMAHHVSHVLYGRAIFHDNPPKARTLVSGQPVACVVTRSEAYPHRQGAADVSFP